MQHPKKGFWVTFWRLLVFHLYFFLTVWCGKDFASTERHFPSELGKASFLCQLTSNAAKQTANASFIYR